MNPILWLINSVLEIYLIFIIASAIISLLISFNIINRYQPFVQQVNVFLSGITEPAYRRIRPYLPQMGGFDLSPLVLYVLVRFVQYTINWAWLNAV
jgi:YggT family protein